MSEHQAYGLFDVAGPLKQVADQLIGLQVMPLWPPVLLIAVLIIVVVVGTVNWFALH